MAMELNAIAGAMASGLQSAAGTSARAAARANSISAIAQQAQGSFNQTSANNANAIGNERIASQYGFNSGQAAIANDYSSMMWDKASAWNEQMMQRQMEFNAEEAEKNRKWQEQMRATAYQTAIKDMEAAGLNPILAATGGGIQTGATSGAQASASAPSMGSPSGAMASGGLLQGNQANEGNYTGQMEYMGGILGLLSAGMSGLSSALSVLGRDKSVDVIINNMLDKVGETANDAAKAASKEGNPEKYSTWPVTGAEGTYERQYKQHWKDYWQRKGYPGDYN